MAEDKEKFLSRWSRLKAESKELPEQRPEREPQTPAPVLPEVDKLTADSDFTGFMHPKVEDTLRRVALKKLFSDPHFNVADPFEPYSGDWTVGEPISDELLAQLNQARTLIFNEVSKEPKAVPEAPPGEETTQAQAKDDEPGRKDA